jgi:transcriptional regulator with XRE-family HTH domain
MTPDELKRRRKNLGWTQVRLAQEMGTTQQSVSLWENGERPIPPWVPKLLAFLEAANS